MLSNIENNYNITITLYNKLNVPFKINIVNININNKNEIINKIVNDLINNEFFNINLFVIIDKILEKIINNDDE